MTGTVHDAWRIASTSLLDEDHEWGWQHRHKTFSCKATSEVAKRRAIPTEGAECTKHVTLQRESPRFSDSSSLVSSLRACARSKDLVRGIALHDEILQRGLMRKCSDALVTMYAKCGALAKAQELLDSQESKNTFAWTALISGYAQMGQGQDALKCFDRMQQEGISPDAVTFTCILKACAQVKALDKGKIFHDEIARQGLLARDLLLGNALVDMYAKCGALAQAKSVFDGLPSRDAVSWNVLIAGYAQQEQSEQALDCFERMQQAGLSPDAVTYACVLKACGNMGASKLGEQIHEKIAQQGLLAKNMVLGTALVDMYAKCGAVVKARQVFQELPARDVVSWSALITGYAQQDQAEQAFDCFKEMHTEGLFPDAVTFACILKACGNVGAFDKGKRLHDEIARQGLLRNDVVLGNSLVDMYAKCGALAKAHQVLNELPCRDAVTWNALISGYVHQGEGHQALHCFKEMQCEGLSPNATTFSFVLNVCSHLGLVDDGYMHFISMKAKYGIKPHLEHYSCMIDLFGRAGHLDKAVGMVHEMLASDPLCPSGCSVVTGGKCKCWSEIWCALLSACHKWGDVTIGRWAFEQAMQISKDGAAAYVLMANIYAGAGMQEDAEAIETLRIENNVCKTREHSWWTDSYGDVQSLIGRVESAKTTNLLRQT